MQMSRPILNVSLFLPIVQSSCVSVRGPELTAVHGVIQRRDFPRNHHLFYFKQPRFLLIYRFIWLHIIFRFIAKLTMLTFFVYIQYVTTSSSLVCCLPGLRVMTGASVIAHQWSACDVLCRDVKGSSCCMPCFSN